jgi:hypothetical protein
MLAAIRKNWNVSLQLAGWECKKEKSHRLRVRE